MDDGDGSGDGSGVVQQHERMQQDQHAQEMLQFAQMLKSNATAFGDILHKDVQIMSETQAHMTQNQSRLRKEMARLRVVTERYAQTCWMQVFLTLLVIFTFMGVYLVIKFIPKKQPQMAPLE
jgi:preprotein translocase subunit SecF